MIYTERLCRACPLHNRVRTAQIMPEISMDGVAAKIGYEIRFIRMRDVIVFMAGGKYVTVWHTGGEAVISERLCHLAVRSPGLARINRACLINLMYLLKVTLPPGGLPKVYMRGMPQPFQVSRKRRAEFLGMLQA